MPSLNDRTRRNRVSFRRVSIFNFLSARRNAKNDSENKEDVKDHDKPKSGRESQSQTAQDRHHHPHHLRYHSRAPPLSSNPVHGGEPQLRLPSWSSSNQQEDRIPIGVASSSAESPSSAKHVRLDDATRQKLFANDESRRAAARRKKEREEHGVREVRANEAARIIYASCMAGRRVQKRRARARRLMDPAGTARDGAALRVERSGSGPVSGPDRTAGNADPFPDLYWRAWGHAIPPGLEMDPCGEMWEDVVEEKEKQVGQGGFDGASPSGGGRKRGAASRRRTTRRLQALGWSGLGNGISE
ncbi:hypothetical protein VTH06DRAFT_6646 [Thermothelomyces fergusii]